VDYDKNKIETKRKSKKEKEERRIINFLEYI